MNLAVPFLLLTVMQAPVRVDTATTARAAGPVRPSASALDTASLREPRGRMQERAQLVEYSDAYAVRATIHRYSSYAIVPLFLLQYYTGTQLLQERNGGAYAPDWTHRAHGPLAYGVAGLFAVNTVTGVWNFYEARHDPQDGTRRTLHAGLMLVADAGFAATAFLVPAEEPPQPVPIQRPAPHRNMAYVSMGAALVSYAIMLPFFRKE